MPAITSDSFKKFRIKSNLGVIEADLAADAQSDTLTITAGPGIILSAVEGTDTLTIGATVTINTAGLNDILINGASTNIGITVDDTTFNANSLTVDHATNSLTLTTTGTGVVVADKTLSTKHIIPQTDITYDLGTPDKRYRDIYLSGSTIYLGSATITASGTSVTLPAGSTIAGTSITDTVLPTQSTHADKFLRTNGTSVYWSTIPSAFPDQTGATGKSLTSNGTSVQWTLITPTTLGLGNVTNESKATMFTNSALTGTTSIATLNLNNALSLSYGGTGATSRADALTNLLPSGATAGYVLKTGGSGSYYWAAETGASTIVGTRIDSARQAYTATAAQVLFTGCPTYTIGANQLRVYIGGVRQFPEAYTETSTTSFTLSSGVSEGTKILAEVDGYVSNTVTAAAVVVTPVGDIESTTVQDALSELDSEKAPLDSPAFTGTPTGITATHVGLGNVTNESKATMFTSPAFTGTPTGITATHVGLGNVTNESKATMFTSPTFTGTVSGVTAAHVGLGNVTNESKATMFTSPTFTGTLTLAGVTESIGTKSGATGTVAHDILATNVWLHSAPAANWTVNFTNVPAADNVSYTRTLSILQGTTAYLPTAVQIDGVAKTVTWANAISPSGTASRTDFVTFNMIKVGGVWYIFGNVFTF